ncbi:hypothetical protein H257_02330 [Aphanomyces astaci]|uniref:Uncharacterized protein n=1 Tax=Aphanomyces astaci TaxID=112090 RepID=W4H2C5_APHAT|nr:hypothetical protein H257_02330 [Aphanomyces astaci]ETV85741.1 hypothetical protein H257_02330 [Aphanomyces astaci]|eukprot:XP_009824213.1 hypothetical protein H257_02330 [Aphanomyces astaci]
MYAYCTEYVNDTKPAISTATTTNDESFIDNSSDVAWRFLLGCVIPNAPTPSQMSSRNSDDEMKSNAYISLSHGATLPGTVDHVCPRCPTDVASICSQNKSASRSACRGSSLATAFFAARMLEVNRSSAKMSYFTLASGTNCTFTIACASC